MTISYETPKRLDGESMFEYRRREARLFWNYRLDAIKAMAEGGDTVGAITRLAEMLRQPEPADDTVRPSTGKAEPPPTWDPSSATVEIEGQRLPGGPWRKLDL